MNELESTSNKICSAREILDSAIEALENRKYDKAEALMYATNEFLQYYLDDFDVKFKSAWSETITKLKKEEDHMPPWGHSDLEYLSNNILTNDRVSNFPGEQYTEEELNAMCDKAEQDQLVFNLSKDPLPDFWYDNMSSTYGYSGFSDLIDPAGNNLTGVFDSTMENNAKKWTVPVEVDGASGEYFIQLPDDLLKQVNWEENDELNWINNEDGTFTIRKVTKMEELS
jgi:hypothetical protein